MQMKNENLADQLEGELFKKDGEKMTDDLLTLKQPHIQAKGRKESTSALKHTARPLSLHKLHLDWQNHLNQVTSFIYFEYVQVAA